MKTHDLPCPPLWDSVDTHDLPCPPHWDSVDTHDLPCPPHWDSVDTHDLPCPPHWDSVDTHDLPCPPHWDSVDTPPGDVEQPPFVSAILPDEGVFDHTCHVSLSTSCRTAISSSRPCFPCLQLGRSVARMPEENIVFQQCCDVQQPISLTYYSIISKAIRQTGCTDFHRTLVMTIQYTTYMVPDVMVWTKKKYTLSCYFSGANC